MHHMHKTTALFLALAAATSCKPETVTLGVKKDKDKTQAASHDTLKRASGPPTTHDIPSVPVAHKEANNDTEPIVIQSAGRPTTTHDKRSAPVARQGAATPEIKSLSITHDKEPLQRATKNRDILKALYSATQVALTSTQAALTSTQAALMCASEEIEKLANEQAALKRTVEEKEGNIQTLRGELNAALKRASEQKETLKNVQKELQRTSEEKDVIIRALNEALPGALEHAARTNNEKTLKAFISAGNAVEEKEGQPLWAAYAKAALELIEEKVDINAKDKDGNTLLHTAAKAGNTATVWALIAKGAKVNAKDNDGGTPLFLAAYFGHKDVATILIDNKAVINAKNNYSWTPLHCAAQNGHAAVATLLIDNKADINAKTNNGGDTPLRLAAHHGHIDMVRLLLDNGAKATVNAKGNNGYTPLHCAAMNGHKDVATLLIANGAQVNAKDYSGKTPLGVLGDRRCRISNSKKESMKALLRKHGGS